MPKLVDHDARRAELVEASWQVISDEGLEGLTLRKVAGAADCTTGRITHYFPDREALVLAALRAINDTTLSRTRAVLARQQPPRDILQACLMEGLPLDKARLLEWKVWIAFWGAAASNKVLARENDGRTESWIRELAALVAQVAPECDATLEARLLMGLINGLGLAAAINPTPANLSNAVDAITRHLDRMTA
jgi:AcrR family transcriptional regulator